MRSLFFALGFLPCLLGCATKAPLMGAPSVVSLQQDQNPNVLWITRPIEISVENVPEPRHVIGLFACYRMPQEKPAAPVCYLAKYQWTNEDLAWPGAIYMTQDGLVKTKEQK